MSEQGVMSILVTGGTGFIGSHIISQLLEQKQNLRVRAAVRSISKLETIFPNTPEIEAVEVPTLTSDYTEALRGVDAVIHCANPIPMKETDPEVILRGTVDGALHLVKQALDAGVKKIVYCSSFVTLYDLNWTAAFGTSPLTTEDFCSVPLDSDTIKSEEHSDATMYQLAKAVVERKLGEIAKANPGVEITTILPATVFGPFVPGYPLTPNPLSLGMNYFIYGLFAGNPKTYIPIPTGHGVDVRDVAKAHILALTAPGKDRRFIVCSQVFTWKDISAIIRTERPELANRVPPEDAECPVQTCAPLDDRSTKEVLGLKEYVPWEKTIVDTVDACLEYEKKQMVSTL